MTNYPEKKEKTALTTPEKTGELISPFSFMNQFIQFRYSYTSMSSDGTRTQILARENRFENGRFESEEFEGLLDRTVYDDMAKEMQKYFKSQMELCLLPFSFFSANSKK